MKTYNSGPPLAPKVFGEEFSSETYFFLSANNERAKR